MPMMKNGWKSWHEKWLIFTSLCFSASYCNHNGNKSRLFLHFNQHTTIKKKVFCNAYPVKIVKCFIADFFFFLSFRFVDCLTHHSSFCRSLPKKFRMKSAKKNIFADDSQQIRLTEQFVLDLDV